MSIFSSKLAEPISSISFSAIDIVLNSEFLKFQEIERFEMNLNSSVNALHCWVHVPKVQHMEAFVVGSQSRQFSILEAEKVGEHL